MIVGGAGFIGSHFVDRILDEKLADEVIVYDNFSSGQRWHLREHESDARMKVVEADVNQLDKLKESMTGVDTVIHLASNPDIAKAATDPDIDFREGTVLTRNVLEAMRSRGVSKILYASGSGIYGDLGELEARESHGPLTPISTYGASKLAGEALISSYSYMFDIRGVCFRFGNVIGPRQTHGVGYDFVRKLKKDPRNLSILGDGNQSKSYVHITDIVSAVLMAGERTESAFDAYNVATLDYLTVTEIAEVAVSALGLNRSEVQLNYSGESRGWKGDVPVVRLNTEKIRRLGWKNAMTCKEAMASSLQSLIQDFDSHGQSS